MTTTDWDSYADSFDQEPDHGLLDPDIRAAWAARMSHWLPGEPSLVLDLGCGTGSLALLAAERGHRVTAVDLSPRMAALARTKLAGTGAEVLVGDAGRPPVGERTFDVVLVRHVLWTLPDPEEALRHWWSLLRPGGRLVLIEGVWSGAGLRRRRGSSPPWRRSPSASTTSRSPPTPRSGGARSTTRGTRSSPARRRHSGTGKWSTST